MMLQGYFKYRNAESFESMVIVQQINFEPFYQLDSSHQSLLFANKNLFTCNVCQTKLIQEHTVYYSNIWTASGAAIVINKCSVTDKHIYTYLFILNSKLVSTVSLSA